MIRIPAFDPALAADLLRERTDTPLSAYDVATRAHRRWDRQEFEAAATLFGLAAERELAAPQVPTQQPNYAVRAAVNWSLAGRSAVAEPTLWDATELDWAAAGLPHDTNMAQWAFTRLLLDCSEDFGKLFEQAVARCSELGMSFPGSIRSRRRCSRSRPSGPSGRWSLTSPT